MSTTPLPSQSEVRGSRRLLAPPTLAIRTFRGTRRRPHTAKAAPGTLECGTLRSYFKSGSDLSRVFFRCLWLIIPRENDSWSKDRGEELRFLQPYFDDVALQKLINSTLRVAVTACQPPPPARPSHGSAADRPPGAKGTGPTPGVLGLPDDRS